MRRSIFASAPANPNKSNQTKSEFTQFKYDQVIRYFNEYHSKKKSEALKNPYNEDAFFSMVDEDTTPIADFLNGEKKEHQDFHKAVTNTMALYPSFFGDKYCETLEALIAKHRENKEKLVQEKTEREISLPETPRYK